MKLLLDTHILLWSTHTPSRLPKFVRKHLENLQNELHFSVVSLWEIGVKRALRRPDFSFDPRVLRRELLRDGYHEISLTAEHVLNVNQLPTLHRDPFDRLLICQASVEGLTIATNDSLLTQYPVSALRP